MPTNSRQADWLLFDLGSYNAAGFAEEGFLRWLKSDTFTEQTWASLKQIRQDIDTGIYRKPRESGGCLVFEPQADGRLIYIGRMDINGRVRRAEDISAANPEKRRKPPVRPQLTPGQPTVSYADAISDRQKTRSGRDTADNREAPQPTCESGPAYPATIEQREPRLMQALSRGTRQPGGNPRAA